jgi:hypothetical protein
MIKPTRKQTVLAAGGSLVVGAALLGAGFLATPHGVQAQAAPGRHGLERLNQTPPAPPQPPAPPKPGQGRQHGDPAQRREEMRQRHEAFMNSLAGRLGINREQLNEALKGARIDQINQAVAEGKLDQERANRMIQAIQSGQGMMGPGGPGREGGAQRGPGQHPGGPPGQGQNPGERRGGPPGPEMRGGGMLAANVLGLTPEQLRAEMQAGKTLAEVAQAHGMSRDDFKSKLIAAQKARLDQAVANGRLTAEQAQQVADRFAANLDRMLDIKPGQRQRPPGQPATN